METDFQWIRKEGTVDGERRVSHFLVDPGGRIRADVYEPIGREIAFATEVYWDKENNNSQWISLDLAKTHVELAYEAHLRNEVKKHETPEAPGVVERPETPALPAGAEVAAGIGAPAPVPANADETTAGT